MCSLRCPALSLMDSIFACVSSHHFLTTHLDSLSAMKEVVSAD